MGHWDIGTLGLERLRNPEEMVSYNRRPNPMHLISRDQAIIAVIDVQERLLAAMPEIGARVS